MAGELASALQSAGLHVKAVSGKTSPAALDKAVTDDLADFAITALDALGGGADGPTVATADWRARSPYVMRLAAEPVEVIAPRAITALDQLTGRKVSVAAADGAAAVTAAIVFARAGAAPTLTNEGFPTDFAVWRAARSTPSSWSAATATRLWRTSARTDVSTSSRSLMLPLCAPFTRRCG